MLIALTGGIGAGKSTAASLFIRKGAVVIDADALSREVVEPGTPGLEAIVARFGEDVLDETGALDRAALAEIVFADPGARRELEGIVHPAVGAEILRRVAEQPPGTVVVIDIPLLAETDRRGYDAIVVVEAPEDVRIVRLEERGMSADDARRRIRAQASDEERRAIADYVIDNGRDQSQLLREVDRVWAGLHTHVSSTR